uniref:SAP30_Sin3_bdg domain-containing protein n=1 Tax=Rhabditophanes sp. KR3021 TaxID=114890 RepID=A0AC35TIF0_9BILA
MTLHQKASTKLPPTPTSPLLPPLPHQQIRTPLYLPQNTASTKARFPNPPKTYLTPASRQYLDDLIQNHKTGRKIKIDSVKKDILKKIISSQVVNNNNNNNNEDSMEGGSRDLTPIQFASEELVNQMKFINMFGTYPQESTLTPN